MRFKLELWQVIVLALIVTGSALGLRIALVGVMPVGFEPYSHALASATDGIPNIYESVISYESLYPYVLEFSLLLSAALALSGAVFLYIFLRRAGMDEDVVGLASMIFLMSPVYLSLVLIPSPRTFGFFMLSLALFLSTFRNPLATVFSVGLILLVPFLGIEYALVAVAVVLVYSLMDARIRRVMVPLIAGVSIVSLIFYGYHYLLFGSFGDFYITGESLIQRYLSDFGGRLGFSTFAIFMGAIGLKFIWRRKKTLWPFYLATAILIVLQYYMPDLAVYSTASLSVLSAYSIHILTRRDWRLKQIKDISMLLIVCGFLFSFVLYMNLAVNGLPDNEMRRSLEVLAGQEEGIVLSHYSYGQWIRFFSGKEPFMTNEGYEGHDVSSEIFQTRSIVKATELLNETGIEYIYITQEMKDGLVWEKENEGLLFLFRNREVFTNTYNRSGYQIWEVNS